MKGKAGVYLHTPFCGSRCAYCDFYSNACADAGRLTAYARALARTIRDEAPGVETDTVYFGGGTPSLLGVENLTEILEAVRASFNLAPDAEITLEANPGDVCLFPSDGGKEAASALSALRKAGFNRISLGVQSADDRELRMLSRRHSFADVEKTVRQAREAGFDNMSLDLIYALPDQTMDTWKNSLEALIALEPEHLSCYALKLSENVPLYRLIDRLPDDDTQLEMYLMMVETLEKAGFHQYEISNFAKEGFQSRHNSKYWTCEDYYGYGPSAHSLIRGIRSVWTPSADAFLSGNAVREDDEAQDETEEYLMLRLRMTEGIDPADFEARFGLSFAPFARILQKYEPHGLTARQNTHWRLTPRGAFVSNAIISELFVCLDELL
ncbi:MAG: radical SAM family heme chaperone HemW [Clostridia bacterium]|nr:radical SAM family heme chaperone HemW [Clostridia bacterium]